MYNKTYIYHDIDGVHYKREKTQHQSNDGTQITQISWYFLGFDNFWEFCDDQEIIEKQYLREMKLKRILKRIKRLSIFIFSCFISILSLAHIIW